MEARFTVALPARGRSVLAGWAADILVQNLPRSSYAELRIDAAPLPGFPEIYPCLILPYLIASIIMLQQTRFSAKLGVWIMGLSGRGIVCRLTAHFLALQHEKLVLPAGMWKVACTASSKTERPWKLM